MHVKNKAIKTIHLSGTPWRSIENCMDVIYLKPIGSICTELQDVREQISKAGLCYLPSVMVKKLKSWFTCFCTVNSSTQVVITVEIRFLVGMYLDQAIYTIHYFRDQVAARCPADTKIP